MKPRLPITSTRHPIRGGLDGGLAAASRTAWTRAVGTCGRLRTTSRPCRSSHRSRWSSGQRTTWLSPDTIMAPTIAPATVPWTPA